MTYLNPFAVTTKRPLEVLMKMNNLIFRKKASFLINMIMPSSSKINSPFYSKFKKQNRI